MAGGSPASVEHFEVSDELVMNRFRLLDRIGSGGMGTVYRAYDERLQRQVAVKEIQAAGADRVMREAQACARLNHPAIVTLYELGERNGRALLVSELVDGQTLDQLCAEDSISDREVGEFGVDICEALQHAHSRGVVHRDVKPQNVIVSDLDGPMTRAKLMDFGIAAVAGAPTLTAPGSALGTLAYMAPEQAEGEQCEADADVYSLGLTLFEAWSGVNPVAGSNPAQTARRIGRRQPSLAEFRPELPGTLVAEIDACLEADPYERPAMDELREVIRHSLGELDPDVAVPRTHPDGPSAVKRVRSLPRVAATIAAGVALAFAAGPAGYAGLALLLAVLLAGPLLVARTPAAALAPLLAIPAGAVGALLVVPALIAILARGAGERLVLGGTCFATYLAAAICLGVGSPLGIAGRAPAGWERSAPSAASAVLAPLVDPVALLGIVICAVAALTLGWLLRASLPIALLGGAIWAAVLETSFSKLGNGGLGQHPALALAAVGAALIYEWQARELAPSSTPAPLASARPALHGGS